MKGTNGIDHHGCCREIDGHESKQSTWNEVIHGLAEIAVRFVALDASFELCKSKCEIAQKMLPYTHQTRIIIR